MEKTSLACTVITQVCLCFALYIALNLGHPQTLVNTNAPSDLYFISVKGGFRLLTQQFHLLKQMEKVARAYKASFVVSSSELGEYDPLMQNFTITIVAKRFGWALYLQCDPNCSCIFYNFSNHNATVPTTAKPLSFLWLLNIFHH